MLYANEKHLRAFDNMLYVQKVEYINATLDHDLDQSEENGFVIGLRAFIKRYDKPVLTLGGIVRDFYVEWSSQLQMFSPCIGSDKPFHHTMPTEDLTVHVRRGLAAGKSAHDLSVDHKIDVEWLRSFSVPGKGAVKMVRYTDNKNRSNEICLRIGER